MNKSYEDHLMLKRKYKKPAIQEAKFEQYNFDVTPQVPLN